MEIRVLGPIQVQPDGHPSAVPAPAVQILLALLAVDVNRPVPMDRLTEALWGDSPGPTVHKRLHLAVHRLRRALGDPERVRFVHGGYRLELAPEELDLSRFEDLLDAGFTDVGTRIGQLRAALGLWRGAPFGAAVEPPRLRVEAERLGERRLAGLDELYGAELARGAGSEIVAELTAVAQENPLAERLQARLMTALYRAGRQSDALAAYARTRAVLVGELGVEPGPELAAVQRAVLVGDPAIDPPAALPVPAQLPADVPDFTGRDGAVRELVSLLEGRDRAVVAIAGTAGVGKTALALRVAHRLRERFPDGQLYADLRGAGADTVRSDEVLARFVRALSPPGADMPSPTDERAALLRTLLAGRRMLILLDDAADEAHVRPLLPGLLGCAVLVTSRAPLTALPGATHHQLDLPSQAEARRMLAASVGPRRVADEPHAAAEIVTLCGALPLAIRVAAARIVAAPHRSVAYLAAQLRDERGRLDKLRTADLDVRASLHLSFAGLSEHHRCALRRVGALGIAEFPAWCAAAVLDTDQHAADDTLDALGNAHLLGIARTEGHARYRLHDLVRVLAREVALAEEDPDTLAAALDRAVRGWLVLARVAAARLSADPFAEVETGPEWRFDPAVPAEVAADAVGWTDRELPAIVAVLPAASAAGLDPLVAGFGTTLAQFGVLRTDAGQWQRLGEMTLTAARRCGDRVAEARALRGLGEVQRFRGRHDHAADLLGHAEALFRTAGDQAGVAITRSDLGALHRDRNDLDTAATYLHGAVRTLEAIHDRRNALWALRRLGGVHERAGLLAEAEDCYQRALAAGDGIGDELAEPYVLLGLGTVGTRQGRSGNAEAALDRALSQFRAVDYQHGAARTLAARAELHRTARRTGPALDDLSEALRIWRSLRLPWWQARTLRTLALIHHTTGDVEAARTARAEADQLAVEPTYDPVQ